MSMKAYEARLRRVEADVRRLLAKGQARSVTGLSVVKVGGGGGGGGTYLHKQLVPSTEWVIIHNLDAYPSVTTVDSAGKQQEGDVHYDNNKRVRVLFSAPFSGSAFLNAGGVEDG